MTDTTETREVPTYCRICEPQCGLIAKVEDGVLVSVKPDKEHAHSKGFVCTKSSAMVEVTYDEDRVLQPLRRTGGPGEFTPVTWDEAMADIADRLRRSRAAHGKDSFATFLGNPPAFGYATGIFLGGFQKALGVRWKYTINAEDASARFAANDILYGSTANMVFPDITRSDFVLMLGANPMVSKGSLVSVPNFGKELDRVKERGGRIVVVDPRRTETARRHEHLAIRPGTDAYLLAAMINVLVTEDLVDHAWLDTHTTGYNELKAAVAPFDLGRAEHETGLPGEQIAEIARALAGADRATVYGRTGTCTQRFGTLNNLLQDTLAIITGNLERPGGLVFGWGPIDFALFAKLAGFDTYGENPTRVRNHPEVMGLHPSTSLVPDITTPGEGQVRSLLAVGANPVLTSAGGGEPLEDALQELDLFVSLDLYVNETNRFADYVLPVTTMFEREDFPLATLGWHLEPSVWATEAVIDRRGDVRAEWEILDEIAARTGNGGAYAVAPLRWLARAGIRLEPRTMAELIIRTSRAGDWFGLRRSGTSFKKLLRDHPHGLVLREHVETSELRKRISTKDGRVDVASWQLLSEMERMLAQPSPDASFPLRLVGMREVRSHNSWLHNPSRLMPDTRKHTARIHPDDAADVGLADGDTTRIVSQSGSVEVEVEVTDDMVQGAVALPHGWGHRGGWQRANRAGGVDSNELSSSDPADIEALAAMSILNAIPIRLETVPAG